MVITTKLQHVVFLTFERINPAIGHSFTMCKKEVRKYSFKCRFTDQWNNLPDALVETSSLNAFKNRLYKLWVRNGIMYDPDVDLHATTSARQTRYETMGVCSKLALEAIIRPFPQKSIILYYIILYYIILKILFAKVKMSLNKFFKSEVCLLGC